MHSRAQCPICPHLAHLLRDFIFDIVHFFGGAVRRGPFLYFLIGPFEGGLRGGPPRLDGGPRLLGRRLGTLPRGGALTL